MPKGIYKKSEEHKKKISEAKKGKSSNFKGHKHTEETKRKISKSNKGKQFVLGKHWKLSDEIRKKINRKGKIGEKAGGWRGGKMKEYPKNERIRKSIEYRLWREAVFARDNWVCQKYKIKGGKLNPHHIQNFAQFPELRTSIENGITFSEKAHKEFHKKYGHRNNTKEQLKEFLTNT